MTNTERFELEELKRNIAALVEAQAASNAMASRMIGLHESTMTIIGDLVKEVRS